MTAFDIAKALNEKLGTEYELFRDIVPAVIKSVDGSVHPNNRADMVWIAEFGIDGSRAKVYNNTTLDTADTPVWVGPDPKRPDARTVLGIYNGDLTEVQATATSPHNVGVHGQNHQYPSESDPGGDPVLVFQPAFQPFKTTGDGTDLSVDIQPLIYVLDGVRKEYLGESLDVTAYVPSTASRYAEFLIYLDPIVNTITVLGGTQVATGGAIAAPFPDVPEGMIPSAYVQLTNGQTTISTASHITDARSALYQRAFTNPYGPFRWVWADATERAAETDVTTDDVNNYRLGFQVDTNDIYRATATTPTWQIVAGGGVSLVETANGWSVTGGSSYSQRLYVESAYYNDPSTYWARIVPYTPSAFTQIQGGNAGYNTLDFKGPVSAQYVTISGGGYTLNLSATATLDQSLTATSDNYTRSINLSHHIEVENSSATSTSKTITYTLARRTTDVNPLELFVVVGTSERVSIPANSAAAFTVRVVARRSDADNESAGYWFHGLIDNNSGTTALVGSVTTDATIEDTAAWDCAITASDANDALVVTVTGENSKTIDWVATVELTIVTE